MANYLQVSSNDTLSHRALPGSPETLCGKLIVDEIQPRDTSVNEDAHPNTGWLVQPLECDICGSLSDNNNFLAVSNRPVIAARDCPHCEDGFDSTGNLCWNCGGSGTITESYDGDDEDQFSGLDLNNLRGQRVATAQEETESTAPPTKHFATNWTRDGLPIEDGFNVVISKEEAARIPFIDFTRVSVSEKRDCPDCNESHWLSKIASCDACGTMKCMNCMEDVGPSQFLGICKTCAGADSDLAYESYEVVTDQDRFLAYQLGEDDESASDNELLFYPDAGDIQGY